MSEINKDLIKELLKDYKKPEDIIGKDGILKQLTKALLETALDSELTEHLGYEKNALSKKDINNSRNGKSRKTLKTDHGDMDIAIPRDRQSDFEPQIVQNGTYRPHRTPAVSVPSLL